MSTNAAHDAQIRVNQQLLEERIGLGAEGFLCGGSDPRDRWHHLFVPVNHRTQFPYWNLVIRDMTTGDISLETRASLEKNPLVASWDWDDPVAATKYSC